MPSVSNYLKATNFGFSIPPTATITGIFAEIEKKDNGYSSTDNSTKIVKGGNVSGAQRANASGYPLNDAYFPYGNSTDLWGLDWSASDINAADFGIALSSNLAGMETPPPDTVYVDHIRITVYFTTPPSALSSRIFNSSGGTSAYSTSSLLGWANASSNNSATINYTYKWYLNGALNSTGTFANAQNSTETNIANISSALLSKGQNWTFEFVAYDGTNNSSAINSSTVKIVLPTAPVATGFAGASTNFSLVQNINNVTNLTLEAVGKGTIKFPESYGVDAGGENYDANIVIDAGIVSANSASLDASFNAQSQITINASGIYNSSNTPTIYYFANFTSNRSLAVSSGSNCVSAGVCSGVAWNSSTLLLTFNVTGFSTFAINNFSNFISSCQAITVPESYSLTGPISSQGTCLNITANNTVIDFGGFGILGNGSGIAINLSGAVNVTLKNANISGFAYGIVIDPSYNNTVINSTIFNNSVYGLYILQSNNNTIANNSIYGNGWGVVLNLSSSNNFSSNNVTNNTNVGIWVSENTSTGNIFTSQYACLNGLNVNDTAGSLWVLLTAQNSSPSALWATPCSSLNQLLIFTNNSGSSLSFRYVSFTGGTITLMTNESSNTTNGDTGVIVRNSGNINISVSLSSSTTASSFIGGTSPQFQFWGAVRQPGSCSGLNTSFTEFSGSLQTVCNSLWYNTSSYEFYTYFRIIIGSDAPSSVKSTVITFTSTPV